MADVLAGRRVAFLAADGVEQVELEEPRRALREAGADTELISLKDGDIQAMNGDIEPADRFPVDRPVSQASVGDYDGLVIPGGTVNPDNLRADADAVRFVREFAASGKPVMVSGRLWLWFMGGSCWLVWGGVSIVRPAMARAGAA